MQKVDESFIPAKDTNNSADSPPFVQTLCTIIGIGNDLAGDDGAGIVAIKQLEKHLPVKLLSQIELTTLSGDLYAVEEYLLRTKRIIFIDALAGTSQGEIRTLSSGKTTASPSSFHQTDIATVMHFLEKTGNYPLFPKWEIRGVTILPPDHLKEGLSPPVAAAVNRLVTELASELRQQYASSEEQLPLKD